MDTRKLTTSASRPYYSFSARDWSLVFDPEKPTFPLAQSIKLHISALVRIPCLIPCHHGEKYARESRNSHHLITQRDNIHARAPDMCVDPRGQMTSGWRNFVLKIEKLSHITGTRGSQDLRSPSPIMAPDFTQFLNQNVKILCRRLYLPNLKDAACNFPHICLYFFFANRV